MGVNEAKGAPNFEEKDACVWAFKFNQDVQLLHLMFNGMDVDADRVRVSIEFGETVYIEPKQTQKTVAWSGDPWLKMFTFSEPVVLVAGTPITIQAAGSLKPESNKFGFNAVVVSVEDIPEPFGELRLPSSSP